jgi:hypothetical protein
MNCISVFGQLAAFYCLIFTVSFACTEKMLYYEGHQGVMCSKKTGGEDDEKTGYPTAHSAVRRPGD